MKLYSILFKLLATSVIIAILLLILSWIFHNYDWMVYAKTFVIISLILLAAALISYVWEEKFS